MPLDFAPLADADRAFAKIAAEILTPPPPPDFTLWAQRNVAFGEESPFPGPYDPDRFPYFRRPLECLSPEHAARIVTFMGSAQIGKSVICQVFIGAGLAEDPCHAIYYHPTESNATEWARLKWRPMLRQSERLRQVFGEERSRDGSQSLLFYERADGRGSLTVAGANSGPAVSMKSARIQVQDDLSKWEMLPSGDSETMADSRSKAFLFAKLFKVSTPLLEHNCRITRNFKAGTQERWHVPCPHCGHEQPLLWENMLSGLDREHPERAHFTCAACGAAIEHRHKAEIVAKGRWVAHNAGAHEPSFHLWAAYSPLETWENIARAFIKAEGNPSAEQGFANDNAGEPYQSAGEAPPWEAIRDRAREGGHRKGTVPTGGLLFTAGADCQKDRVEVHCKAFGRDGRRWTVEYRVIEGHISTAECQAGLDALFAETWRDDYGNDRRLLMLAIDGNAWTNDVLGWARRHPWSRVIVTRGARSETSPPLVPVQSERRPDGRARRQQKRFYNLGVSGLKSTLYKALEQTDPLARGFCGYPQGLDDDFYEQLCAERRVQKKSPDGSVLWRWVKHATQANEVLDTELIAEGAAIRCGWRAMTDAAADRIEAELTASGAAAQAERQPDLFDPARAVQQALPGAAAPAPAPAEPVSTPAPPDADPADASPPQRGWLGTPRRGKWFG
jgi:phage terminase large subunit GpA-like protein